MTDKQCVASIGFRARKGGAAVVAVALQPEPRVLHSSFLATAAVGDRLSLEPYHIAHEMNRGADGKASIEMEAAIADGRQRQSELATRGIGKIVRELGDGGYRIVGAALLVNRAGWVKDLMSYSLASPDHPAVAEGLAVRESIRLACRSSSIGLTELDEKSLPEVASTNLGLTEAEINTILQALGAGTKRWRKEDRDACLAAWLLLAGSR